MSWLSNLTGVNVDIAKASGRDPGPAPVIKGPPSWEETMGSKWEQINQDLLGAKKGQALDQSQLINQSAEAKAMQNLAMRGGASGAARANIASDTMGNMVQQQGAIGSDFYNQSLDSQIQQMQDKSKYELAVQQGKDTSAGARYGAQVAAAASPCCFIFLEARYGTGAMDLVVRKYRDEFMTERNKRGYYKLSEVLVPLMRKSKVVKFLTRALMTDPLVAYGKAYYGSGSKLGLVFAPVKNFWLKTFDYLGQDHKFVRENGEVI